MGHCGGAGEGQGSSWVMHWQAPADSNQACMAVLSL